VARELDIVGLQLSGDSAVLEGDLLRVQVPLAISFPDLCPEFKLHLMACPELLVGK